jgi:hypothetical protein
MIMKTSELDFIHGFRTVVSEKCDGPTLPMNYQEKSQRQPSKIEESEKILNSNRSLNGRMRLIIQNLEVFELVVKDRCRPPFDI